MKVSSSVSLTLTLRDTQCHVPDVVALSRTTLRDTPRLRSAAA